MTVSWLTRALTLGLLAITLPLAARGLYGPPGAVVHIRWQPSVNTADRQRLETTRRHGQITIGAAYAVGLVDRLAMLLAMLAAVCALVRHPMQVLRECVTGMRPASGDGAVEAVELSGRSSGEADTRRAESAGWTPDPGRAVSGDIQAGWGEMSGNRVRWERRLMAVLAVVGLAAAWAQHGRSDDSAGRSGVPLIGLTLSGNDIAHFERIYDRLQNNNRVSPFYRENNRWRRAQLRFDGTVYNVRVKSHGRIPNFHSVERDGHRFISLSIQDGAGRPGRGSEQVQADRPGEPDRCRPCEEPA